MYIAVTGSEGAVGRIVVATAARQGHRIRRIDRVTATKQETIDQLPLEYVEANLSDYDSALQALRGCDAVIHTAALVPAPGRYSDAEIHNNNVQISYNVLHAAGTLGINRVTQISSSNAIGSAFTASHRHYSCFPVDEREPCQPEDAYSLSKLVCELQAVSLCRKFPQMRVASLRISLCFPTFPGPGSGLEGMWAPSTEEQLAMQMAVNDCWSWVLDRSVAEASILGLTSSGWQGAEVFFISASRSRPVEEGLAMSSLELAMRYHPQTPIRPGWFDSDIYRSFIDCTKAERMLGWKHEVRET